MKKVLLLNGSGEPLNFCSWKRAFAMLTAGKVRVLETYDASAIAGGGAGLRAREARHEELLYPVVIQMKRTVEDPAYRLSPGRRNIFHRDDYTCLYCGAHGEHVILTLDHVVPRCDGGRNTWENLATACFDCNQKKAFKSLADSGLILQKEPGRPGNTLEFRAEILCLYGLGHESWSKYLAMKLSSRGRKIA